MSAAMTFTAEEINFICVAYNDTVDDTISRIFDMLPHIEDKAMLAIGESVINKLEEMNDEEFTAQAFKEKFADLFAE